MASKKSGRPNVKTLLYVDALRELSRLMDGTVLDMRLTEAELQDLRHPGFGFKDALKKLVRSHLKAVAGERAKNQRT